MARRSSKWRRLADLLALEEDGAGDAVKRAGEGGIREAPDGMIERGLPGITEALRIDPCPQRISRVGRLADALARLAHAAALGQRLDEGELRVGRPAIVAGSGAMTGSKAGMGERDSSRGVSVFAHEAQ